MVVLPEYFKVRVEKQLGAEFEEFMKCYKRESYVGLRMNTGKIRTEDFQERVPFALERVPWTENGFYYKAGEPVTKHPYYYAGLYYIQEPSAMLPAARLPVCPGDVVLDLCAAPGGKATELSSRLRGKGLLVANDISASRAGALVKNLALWGSRNCCVTGETPQRLLEHFGMCFDKILVDAPCSGEGMFRRDHSLVKAWQERGPQYYAAVQKEILSCVVRMLRPGGMLLYSTCTFSVEEDEDVVAAILEQYPGMELVVPEWSEGFSRGAAPCEACVRLWPHRVKGEGHFMALLRKTEGAEGERRGETEKSCIEDSIQGAVNSDWNKPKSGSCVTKPDRDISEFGFSVAKSDWNRPEYGYSVTKSGHHAVLEQYASDCLNGSNMVGPCSAADFAENESVQRRWTALPAYTESEIAASHRRMPEAVRAFLSMIPEKIWKGCVYEQRKEQCLLLPPYRLPEKLRYLKTGILAGTQKNGRFEPSQALAMLLDTRSFPVVIDLPAEDERVMRYLRGETVGLSETESGNRKGWALFCTDGFALGWGKIINGSLKNKYYPGWRLQ